MWELDYKESWVLKNWCFWTVVQLLEKSLESPLDCQEMQPVHPKGNQCWIFIGRTDAEAETLVFWSSDTKSWLTGKVSDAGKDWGQKERRPSVLQSIWSQRVRYDWLNNHHLSISNEGKVQSNCGEAFHRLSETPPGELTWKVKWPVFILRIKDRSPTVKAGAERDDIKKMGNRSLSSC